MVNAVQRFFEAKVDDDKLAIVFFDGIDSLHNKKKSITFGELKKLTIQYQEYLESLNLGMDDSILLFEEPSPRLFAFMIAIMASGHQVLVIEPWLPLANIGHIIEKVKPKVFVAKTIGKLWGLRSKHIRKIKTWTSTKILEKQNFTKSQIDIKDLDPEHHAILTFTSGTSGKPKGVYRKHQFLNDVSNTIKKYLEYEKYPGTDLTIFTNLVLGNLGLGKGSIVIPSKWPVKALKQLDLIPPEIAPDTMACGPAFLKLLMKHANVPSLKSIHVGGALTDCEIFEKAFAHFPNAHFDHIYGSSEAEPVATMDAKEAVKLSRAKGFFQCLALGKTISEITSEYKEQILWVTGNHVSPLYVDDDNANAKNKYQDENGQIWHNMGDRSYPDENDILWYQGRDFQSKEEFLLEQEIYTLIQSSMAMIHKYNDHYILIYDCDIDIEFVKKAYPKISRTIRSRIYRDLRHRARIDRVKTVRKAKL